MANLMTGTSGYQLGQIDTATPQVDDDPIPLVGEASAAKINGITAGIIQIETILGEGTTLKGSATDLVTRLAVNHNPDGSHQDVALGALVIAAGKRLTGDNDSGRGVAVDMFRRDVYTSSDAWTCPDTVTQVFAEVYGAGGGAGGTGGLGISGTFGPARGSAGSNGGYASALITVAPGVIYPVTVGSAGAGGSGGGVGGYGGGGTGGFGGGAGSTGGTSSFNTTDVRASGGDGGSGGGGGDGSGDTGGPGDGLTPGTNGATAQFFYGPGAGLNGTVLVSGTGRGGGAPNATASAAGGSGQSGMVVIWY